MRESNTAIEDHAEELSIAYGVPYGTALTALWHVIGCGCGMSEPIEVSIEEYEWLQKLLLGEE